MLGVPKPTGYTRDQVTFPPQNPPDPLNPIRIREWQKAICRFFSVFGRRPRHLAGAVAVLCRGLRQLLRQLRAMGRRERLRRGPVDGQAISGNRIPNRRHKSAHHFITQLAEGFNRLDQVCLPPLSERVRLGYTLFG